MDGAHRLGESVGVRPHIALVAVSGIALIGLGIHLSGNQLREATAAVEIDDIPELDVPAPEDMPAERQDKPDEAARIDADTGLERVAPRPPLSELSTPQPPKPPKTVPPDRWRLTRLFNPVATQAGIIEAQGYRVALTGIEPLDVEAKCSFEGGEWPCGVRARTAFRAWLRARAISCKVPPEPDRELIAAECRVGNEDPAQWLAENGWAKPAARSGYAEFGQQAEAAKRGMFGAPPKRVGMTIFPAGEPPRDAAVPAEPVTPPASLPAPSQ